MKNEQILKFINQINNGTGIGKLTNSDLNGNGKLKLKVHNLIQKVKNSDAAKSIVEYQQELANKIQNKELSEQEANRQFFEALEEESELEVEPIQIDVDKELPFEFTSNDMNECVDVVEFVDNS